MAATTVKSRSSALLTLEEIDRWADSRQEPIRILTNIACLIGNRLECDACSIYRVSHESASLILAATIGLRQDCVGRLEMKITEGLTGLVVEDQRPLEIAAQASTHPRFKYFPDAGEEPYETFFGVPIVDRHHPVGVLVVQTVQPRRFSPVELHMLTAAGRRLGPLLGRLSAQSKEDRRR